MFVLQKLNIEQEKMPATHVDIGLGATDYELLLKSAA